MVFLTLVPQTLYRYLSDYAALMHLKECHILKRYRTRFHWAQHDEFDWPR